MKKKISKEWVKKLSGHFSASNFKKECYFEKVINKSVAVFNNYCAKINFGGNVQWLKNAKRLGLFCINISSVVEFQRWWVLKSKIFFWPKIYIQRKKKEKNSVDE